MGTGRCVVIELLTQLAEVSGEVPATRGALG